MKNKGLIFSFSSNISLQRKLGKWPTELSCFPKEKVSESARRRPISGWILSINSTFKNILVNSLVVPASASGAECPLLLFFASFPQGLGHCSYSSSFDNCLSLGSPWSLEEKTETHWQKLFRGQHFLFTGLLSLPTLPTQGDHRFLKVA